MRGIDLKVGDRLKRLRGESMLWNRTSNQIGPHTPDYVDVVAEYDRFFIVEPHFSNIWGEENSYREALNKYDLLAGFVQYKKE